MALFWAAFKRDSVSLLKFPFLRRSQIASREIFAFLLNVCFLVNAVLLTLALFVLFLVTFVLFYVVFESRLIDVPTQSSMLANPLLFLTHTVCHCYLWNVRSYVLSCVFRSLVHLLNFFFFFFFFFFLLLLLLLLLLLFIRVFHISVSWWFFTSVWVTASLLKSPGLVSGFCPFSAMLSFG